MCLSASDSPGVAAAGRVCVCSGSHVISGQKEWVSTDRSWCILLETPSIYFMLGGPQSRRCRKSLVVQALRDLAPAAPAPRGAPIPHTPLPHAALPHHYPRAAYKLGARVTRIYRR